MFIKVYYSYVFLYLGTKPDDPENVDWIPTKFKFNEASALKATASKKAHSDRHKIISLKLQSNDSSSKNPMLVMEHDAKAMDHSSLDPVDLHAEHLVAENLAEKSYGWRQNYWQEMLKCMN